MTAVVPAATGLDPALPRLAEGTDAQHVRRLASLLPVDGPPGTSVLDAVRMHTDYRPGSRCLVSYRLRLTAPGREPWYGFGRMLVHPDGLDLRWYDADPELPALRVATDPIRMGERLAGWTGVAGGDWRVRPIRYRAGTRSVLRYRSASAPRVLFGKLHRQDAERHARAQAGLRDALDAERGPGTPRPRVPDVVGCDARLGLVVLAAARGRALGALAFDPAVDEATRLRALHLAGGQLAGLHVSAGTGGPVRVAADDIDELRRYLPAVRQVDGGLADRYARLLDRVDAVPGGLGGLAPAHGALRTDQLLLGPDGIVLLDLDGLAWAEPARDLGNLLGYLSWRAVRRPGERAALTAAGRAFAAGYRAHGPRLDPARLHNCQAITLLKIAGRRYRSLASGEWPMVPELLDRAGALLPTRRRPARRPGPGRPAAALPEVTEPARMAAELAPLLGDGPALPVRSADLLAHRDGRAAVVRYRLGTGPDGDRVLLGKLFPDAAVAQRVHEIHRRLHAALSENGPALPEPVGVVPARAMLVLRPVDGTPVDRLPAEDAVAAADAAAGWLARLHGSAAGLARRLDLATERDNVTGWATTVGVGLPELAAPARELATGLVAGLRALPTRHDVPIHKDFHYQHVLVGAGAAAIDLDEARMGDPALDVAHFCGYLDLLAGRRPGAGPLRTAFLRGYAGRRGEPDADAFRVFSAWTCLKIAKQLATGRGPHPRPAGAAARDQARHVLARGRAWLG
jgi:aminoglycoside phosphotransferase (APT) family kinase protein